MSRYLLDTNAYFEIIKSVICDSKSTIVTEIIQEDCFISKLTKIEIISVIGKYARGQSKQIQICNRVHKDSNDECKQQYIIEARRKWNPRKLRDWLKLENEITSGMNECIKIGILDVNEQVVNEAEDFINNALTYNFKSMDAMILGTAKAYSTDEAMIVVTADKGLKAGMSYIQYPFISLV